MPLRRWMRDLGMVFILFHFAVAFGAAETDGATHSPSEEETWANEQGIVKELYAYAGQLHSMKSAERLAAYEELAQDVTECHNPRRQLKLALLISGVEPELTDRSLARKLLNACKKKSRGPILSGYIHDRLRELSLYERHDADIETLREKLAKVRHENKILRKKVETLENKLKALTKVEEGLQHREQNHE